MVDPARNRPLDEALLFFDMDMADGEIFAIGGGSAAVYSHRSPLKAGPNEDSAAVIPVGEDRAVLVVADGAGGSRAGALASSLAIRELSSCLASVDPADGLRGAVLNGFERANAAVAALGIGAATTLAAVTISGNALRPFHVGDSMILVVGQRGVIKLQTVSHSPVGYAVEAGYLDVKEALHHDDRHIVSNMIGAPDMRIEVGSSLEMAARDTVLIASDGVSDNLHIDEIVERVRKGRLSRVVKSLAADALHRMSDAEEGQPSKADDLTFVAFRRIPPRRRSAPPKPAP